MSISVGERRKGSGEELSCELTHGMMDFEYLTKLNQII